MQRSFSATFDRPPERLAPTETARRVFPDRALRPTLTNCHVLTEMPLAISSDHAPVIAEFGAAA